VTHRVVEAYGDGPLQRGEWWVPEGTGLLPTVVLVHGGFWRPTYDRSLEEPVAAFLCGRGFLCWNIDYAGSDRPWPATLTDVAAAYDHLLRSELAGRVDPARIAVVGHSAGGHLALWLASRHRLPVDAPGAPDADVPRPRLCVAQAPVAALTAAARGRLGNGAVELLVDGSPDAVPERYAVADPVALLPTAVDTILIHGRADLTVPVQQSEVYVEAAVRAGDDARLQTYDGEHFEHLDVRSAAVALLTEALNRLG
jgi:acetyl esterase/lipase